jgi:very-short-patch-repair endonuclease
MRNELSKLRKGHSTKAERRFAEILKREHIPFKTKVKINNREIDFLIRNYAIDIDGHDQASGKNEMLVKSGYIPIHISNKEVQTNEFNKLSRWVNKFR